MIVFNAEPRSSEDLRKIGGRTGGGDKECGVNVSRAHMTHIRANVAHIRQARPDSAFGLQVKEGMFLKWLLFNEAPRSNEAESGPLAEGPRYVRAYISL